MKYEDALLLTGCLALALGIAALIADSMIVGWVSAATWLVSWVAIGGDAFLRWWGEWRERKEFRSGT